MFIAGPPPRAGAMGADQRGRKVMNGGLRRSLSILAFVCLTSFAGAFNPSGAAAQSGASAGLDTSRLPRVNGAKQIYGSPVTTMFTTPTSVAQTAEATRKLLTAAGWQVYTMPHTAYAKNPNSSTTSLKKGSQTLTVFIGVAPAQGNATSVQYGPAPMKVDLPFPKDGTAIEYDPFMGILNCLTAEPLDKTLAFYREALGKLGWALWSVRLGAKQPANSGPGELVHNGAYAYYVQDGKEPLKLTLGHEKDKLRVRIEPYPRKVMEQAHQEMVNADRRANGLPVAAAQPAPKSAPAAPKKPSAEDKEFDAMMKMAEQQVRNAIADAMKPAKPVAPAPAGSDEIPHLRADNAVPIPLPDTAEEIKYKADRATVDFDSQSSVGGLAAFYRGEMKKRGWREHRSVINRSNMVVLDFSKSKDKLNLTIMKMGNHTNVSGRGSVLAGQAPKTPAVVQNAVAQKDAAATATAKKPPLAMPADAYNIDYDNTNGRLYFTSATGVKALTDFYKAELTRQGWKESSPAFQNRLIAIIRYAKGDDGIEITINSSGNATNVDASGSFLKSAAAKNAPPSADDLKAEEAAGLPVPKARESVESEKSPMRRALKASVQLTLATTLDFYRRELGKRHWKENKGAVVAADHAELAFTSPDGPAMLKLGRMAGHTTVDLAVKDPAAAAKLGVLPKPGQAKVVFGNTLKSSVVITVQKKRIKLGAEVGAEKPNGPKLDLPPGKYKFVVALPGKPAQTEDVDLAADETWGLIVGPGGLLPLHVY
jgi:catechol 2,3-dioxygenase-like lactoylglutathione lyase family enzyme